MPDAVEIMARAMAERRVAMPAKAFIDDAEAALSALEREGFVVVKPRTSRNGLTVAQLATLREMSSYSREYYFRLATCRELVALGLAEPTSNKKRPAHRITEAGRSAIASPGSKSP